MKRSEDNKATSKPVPAPYLPPGFHVALPVTNPSDRKKALELLLAKGPLPKAFREIFEAFRATGISPDGVEHPFQRTLEPKWIERINDFKKRNPPDFVFRPGGHLQGFPTLPSEAHIAAFVSSPPPHYVEDQAIQAFITFTGTDVCFAFAKCVECGRYFDMGRLPKEEYPHGVHCPDADCQRAQSKKGTIAAAERKRYIEKVELIFLAATALKGWGEPSTAPDSKWILEKARLLDPKKVKRFGLTVNFITRNRKHIDELASQMKLAEEDKRRA